MTVLPCAENVPRESRQRATEPLSLSLNKLTITGMAGPIKDRNSAMNGYEQKPEQ